MEGRKRPGGAEKARLKKSKALEEDAAKCAKLTDLISRGQTPAAAASEQQTPSDATDDPEEAMTTEGTEQISQSDPAGEPSRHGEARTTESAVEIKGDDAIMDYERVKGAADVFVSWANEKLEEADSELVVETARP
ncbi:hypothetical protein SRHO_G00206540 [Serrasalmus rhombeus]